MSKIDLAVVGHFAPPAADESITGGHALSALAALGQPTRLEIFRLLMRSEPAGLAAGLIAEAVGSPHNTLSTHLAILARAGLVRGTRDGRSIVYRADVAGIRSLVGFLLTECCNGHPELCDLQDALRETGCCGPASKPQPRKR